MKRLLIAGAVIAAVAVVVVLATTLGGGGGSNDATSSSPHANGKATVSAMQLGDAGDVLVDSSGRALYASNQEANGKVLCTDACLSFWKPLTIAGGKPTESGLDESPGVTRRPDGSRQVTYDGRLLYSFTQDSPGQVTGDGFEDAFGGRQFTWHVVQSDGSTSGGSSGGGIPGY